MTTNDESKCAGTPCLTKRITLPPDCVIPSLPTVVQASQKTTIIKLVRDGNHYVWRAEDGAGAPMSPFFDTAQAAVAFGEKKRVVMFRTNEEWRKMPMPEGIDDFHTGKVDEVPADPVTKPLTDMSEIEIAEWMRSIEKHSSWGDASGIKESIRNGMDDMQASVEKLANITITDCNRDHGEHVDKLQSMTNGQIANAIRIQDKGGAVDLTLPLEAIARLVEAMPDKQTEEEIAAAQLAEVAANNERVAARAAEREAELLEMNDAATTNEMKWRGLCERALTAMTAFEGNGESIDFSQYERFETVRAELREALGVTAHTSGKEGV